MPKRTTLLPKARQDKLLVQAVGDELVVYDQERHHAHCLNPSAALVWRYCDGQTSIAEITMRLRDELNLPSDDQFVWQALDQLERARLLRNAVTPPSTGTNISRREMIGRLLSAGAVLLLPVVTSILVPTASEAQSCETSGDCFVGDVCVQVSSSDPRKECRRADTVPPPGEPNCCEPPLNGVCEGLAGRFRECINCRCVTTDVTRVRCPGNAPIDPTGRTPFCTSVACPPTHQPCRAPRGVVYDCRGDFPICCCPKSA
jgi:hypothetical protein